MKKIITQACIVMSIFLNLSSVVFSQDNTWFIDKTTDLGLSSFPPGGVMGLDMTNDGYPDLLSVSSAGCAIYINTDDPNSANPLDRIFVDATAGSGLNITNVPIQMASAADFNNDGNIDIITNVWAPSSDSTSRCHIFMGDGSGHFTLKSNSGLEALGGMSGTALPILDFDKDGNLDLFIGTHYETGTGTVMPNYLMKGNGDGTFTNVSTSSSIASVVDPLFGANIADWNNDCNQDILTAPYLDAGFGDLWKNNGNNTFTDVATSIGYNPHWMTGDAGQGMVPWAAMPADYDNDGDIDFVVLLVHGGNDVGEGRTSIFTNQGAAGNYILVPEINRIVRNTPVSSHHGDHNGWWFDFDNDGWQDLIIGEAGYTQTDRMYFLKQDASHNFIDVTKNLGFISSSNVIQTKIKNPTQMISMDYDLDGDDDFFKAPYYASSPFLALRNDAANKSHHIGIKLIAPPGVNKSCIGARVYVKSGGVKQQKDIYAGHGNFASQQSPFTLNFGIGANTTIDSIIVRWPDASCSQTIVTNVPVDRFIQIGQFGLVAINENSRQNAIFLYPNPAYDFITFKSNNINSKDFEIKIYNILGELVTTEMHKENNHRINIGNLSNGTYILVIRSQEFVESQRLIINR